MNRRRRLTLEVDVPHARALQAMAAKVKEAASAPSTSSSPTRASLSSRRWHDHGGSIRRTDGHQRQVRLLLDSGGGAGDARWRLDHPQLRVAQPRRCAGSCRAVRFKGGGALVRADALGRTPGAAHPRQHRQPRPDRNADPAARGAVGVPGADGFRFKYIEGASTQIPLQRLGTPMKSPRPWCSWPAMRPATCWAPSSSSTVVSANSDVCNFAKEP